METLDKKSSFITLRAKGFSYDKIAKELNVSKTTLVRWYKESKLEIENAIQFEKDKLIETYKANSNQRLEVLLRLFQKLKAEIDRRDFSELPDAKLVENVQIIYGLLQKEIAGITYSEMGDIFEDVNFNVSRQSI